LLGVDWGPLKRFDMPYRRADGSDAVAVGFTISYSLGAPHLELVQAVPGSPWECNEYSNLHHLGYLVDDPEASSRHLAVTACPMRAHGVDPSSGALGWAYHRDAALGFRIEIVDAAAAPVLGPRMLGGTNQFDAPLTAQF